MKTNSSNKEANAKTLCLFTTTYPYGQKVETFIDSELGTMSETFDRVYVFPANYDNPVIRPLPENFRIVKFENDWAKHSTKLFYKNFSFIIKTLLNEFLFSPSKLKFLGQIGRFKNIIVHKLYAAQKLAFFIEENKLKDATFYSYWLNDWTIVLGILKFKGTIKNFFSRIHGYDLYEDRWPNNIIPFRYFQLKMVDKVFSVSKRGYNYLKNKNIFLDKIEFSYLGIADSGTNPFQPNQFVIVSCSNLMPLKRVHLIVEILKNIKFPTKWVHFGDGKLFEQVKLQAKNLPSNIIVEFKGHVSNKEVLEYYKSNSVNLFILVSEMEGLPMSLIEACSFGIPLMGTNVDGIPEIVNEKTGVLVPKDFDPGQVASDIANFRESAMNSEPFRLSVKQFWKENFHDQTNYTNFYNSIVTTSTER